VNRYFNAGVLLIDLDKWRSLRIMEKSMTYLQLRPDTPYADQDALNVACDGQWKELREQWNYQTLYHHPPSGPAMLPANAQVIHFITGDKPWKASIPNPYASLYDEFRSRTCFARTMPDQIFDGMASGWAQTKLALKQISLVRCALRYVHGRGVPTHQRKGA
jgi:lipopolysaccharide biosynthesis glycosyltransferase